jgi:hypothetical protein
MGLEASVLCNCYAEGITTPCPFPEWFTINQTGFPELNVAHQNITEADEIRFHEWLQTCCAHPGMIYAGAYVSNWEGYNAFLTALDTVGEEHFPTLVAELPGAEGGLTMPDAAAKALRELEFFRAQDDVGKNMFVVNGETGEKLFARVPEHENVFIWDGRNGLNIGLDDEGLFIEDSWELSRIVFRARHIEQILLDPDVTDMGGDGRVTLVDVDSGRRFDCKTPIPGKEIPWPDGRIRDDEGRFRLEYPRLINVEEHTLKGSDFESILRPLTMVLEASVTTGNPVRWDT